MSEMDHSKSNTMAPYLTEDYSGLRYLHVYERINDDDDDDDNSYELQTCYSLQMTRITDVL